MSFFLFASIKKREVYYVSSSALQFFYFYTSNPSFLKHTKCASTNFLHLSSSAPNFPTHSSRRSFVSGHAQQIFFFAFFFVFCAVVSSWSSSKEFVFVVFVFVFQNIIFPSFSSPREKKTNKTRKFPTPPRTRRRRRKDAPRREGGQKVKMKLKRKW